MSSPIVAMSHAPFRASDVSHAFDPSVMVHVEIEAGASLYAMVLAHLHDHAHDEVSTPSRRIADSPSAAKGGACCAGDESNDSDDDDECATSESSSAKTTTVRRPTSLSAGLGLFSFEYAGAAKLWALHQTIGSPVGSQCGVELYTNLVLFAERAANGLEVIQSFCDQLLRDSEMTRPGMFTIFKFNARQSTWRREARTASRPVESVVLPAETKRALVADMVDFLAPRTQRWYRKHGIPYRRSYLFHGTPGAGKTSLIQALAGEFERNLCYLNPSHPDMTDDALKHAVERAPVSSLIVLEDIDALFSKQREAKVAQSKLTFSGLLNALDGVGSSSGQVFILTTNFKEKLDDALIRPGRVDLHVAFTDATREQMVTLFAQFYKRAPAALADAFADAVVASLGGRDVSMASLQHFFVASRKRTAEEAVAHAADVAAELERRSAERAPADGKDAGAPADGAAGEGDGAAVEPEAAATAKPKSKTKGRAGGGNGGVHVHIYGGARCGGAGSDGEGDGEGGE
ncbi:hypothetical protein KFE25_001761 [Diacronema lutheri]|uniref:AAA+ ATPase domain-containing protein n=1 Tax=Diacronema lutheri TaxID=2081491 RepID=A0A8J5XFD1_DIALT|nr:hypothetical protein KFE25_001761 [Diacronema lutheri]